MSKVLWPLDSLDQLCSVFDVGSVVSYFWVKNVLQAVFSHKVVWENANALLDLVVEILAPPHFPETLDRVDSFLEPPHVDHQVREGDPHLCCKFSREWRLLDKAENRLAIVFGNILCVIFLMNNNNFFLQRLMMIFFWKLFIHKLLIFNHNNTLALLRFTRTSMCCNTMASMASTRSALRHDWI